MQRDLVSMFILNAFPNSCVHHGLTHVAMTLGLRLFFSQFFFMHTYNMHPHVYMHMQNIDVTLDRVISHHFNVPYKEKALVKEAERVRKAR